MGAKGMACQLFPCHGLFSAGDFSSFRPFSSGAWRMPLREVLGLEKPEAVVGIQVDLTS